MPFPGLDAFRLHWPADSRPPGASLHAKIIVIDDRVALVGSANLTSRAMETNLECGILIRGGPQPRAIRDHTVGLYAAGSLRRLLRSLPLPTDAQGVLHKAIERGWKRPSVEDWTEIDQQMTEPYSLSLEFKPLVDQPVPVWVATVGEKTHRPPITELTLRKSFNMLSKYVEFRGVEVGRLPTILATGVDVEPTTAPIFVSDLNKAWEYGDWPKVVMAYDGRCLEYTYREITISETTTDEIARLMMDYPTKIESPDGDRVWLTRLPETDTRAATPYEAAFARWIPENPFDALLAVFVFIPEIDSPLTAYG
jgi:hypothetical protein